MMGAFHQQAPDGSFDVAACDSSNRTRLAGRTEGEARKREQLTLLRERRAIYVRRGQRALLERLLDAETATADDVYESVELPEGIDPRCLGVVPGSLARAGIIRSLGFVKSARPKRHASPIRVWTLADRAAALAWLAANPDLLSGDGLPPLPANEERPTVAAAGREAERPHRTESLTVKERTQSDG